jgi:type IV pilus assembly protein PilY1
MDFYTQRGWYINLPDSGERINVNPVYNGTALIFPSLVPAATICTPGGYGWLNYVGIDGSTAPGVTDAAQKTSSPLVGPPIDICMDGNCTSIGTTTDGKTKKFGNVPPPNQSGGGFSSHQSIWRVMKY